VSLLGDEKIILIGGPGGVGKTTVAAALGVHLAESGLRTLVLTVDPARRLAQALGLSQLGSELQTVEVSGTGSLKVSMLDTQRYFDKIICRFAKDEKQQRKILQNSIYRTMVDSLGGTHEYAAMERLYEFADLPDYDRIVVDTPPSQNALDLFQAPQRLAEFMENSVIKWFQGPTPRYLQFFRHGTKLAMKLLQTVFGAEFLDRFAALMNDFDGMQNGFRERHLALMNLMQSDRTAFFLVTYPSEGRYLECRAFLETLTTLKIRLRGLVLNRVEPSVPQSMPQGADAFRPWWEYQRARIAEQARWREKFGDLSASLRSLPRLGQDIHNTRSLSQLGRMLVS